MSASSRLLGSRLKEWLKTAKHWLYRYLPRFSDWRFWVVQALVVIIAAAHYAFEQLGYLAQFERLYFVPISLLIIPVAYAALNFGLIGSISTAAWVLIISIPNVIFWHSGLERFGEAFQMVILVCIAVFIGQRVDREVSARHKAEDARASIKTYAAHVINVQEEERKRIARDLHDESIQTLALLCRRLDSIESAGQPLPSSVIEELREARKIGDEVVKDLREFARALRPSVLDDLGLVASIRRLLLDYTDRTGIKSQLKLSGEERRLSPDTEIGMFRIAQEAMWNVERHSKATVLLVTMYFNAAQVRMDINDNGTGFNVPALPVLLASGHLGLLGMQERAELLGGKLEIQSSPQKGATISFAIPISQGH
jgi:two-component system, NarL family, sensor histidine kinase DegS